jgi:uncharacterized protein with FMN-binding domain
MKKWLVGILACTACLGLFSCGSLQEIRKLTIENIDVHGVKDGVYVGRQDNTMVTAEARVIVTAGRITGITLLEHSHGPNHGADAILDRVIAGQSLQVDSVSGATFSSKVVLKAIEIALKKGL